MSVSQNIQKTKGITKYKATDGYFDLEDGQLYYESAGRAHLLFCRTPPF
jgi:hypothetical protein